jgi:hypothetical protein
MRKPLLAAFTAGIGLAGLKLYSADHYLQAKRLPLIIDVAQTLHNNMVHNPKSVASLNSLRILQEVMLTARPASFTKHAEIKVNQRFTPSATALYILSAIDDPRVSQTINLILEDCQDEAELAQVINGTTDVNGEHYGKDIPLIAATKYNATSTANLLLIKGADPNKPDADGNTPLHFAITYPDNGALVFGLIDCGANTEAVNKAGRIALDGYADLRQIIEWERAAIDMERSNDRFMHVTLQNW